MILDTSAIVAILTLEPGYEQVARAMGEAQILRISAATLLELWIVTDNRGGSGVALGADELLQDASPIAEPVTISQVRLARAAYRRFGKGSGHPAKLNFGDCFAYALAREKNEPLLFVGNDFSHTDVTPALTL